MDKISVNRKYSYIIGRFEKLKEFIQSYDEEKDEKKKEVYYLALQRLAEEVVETAIKINIFILKEKRIFPKTYQESFLKLKFYCDFSEKDLDLLSQTVKFRNIIAHEYIDLDEKEFIENFKKLHFSSASQKIVS